MLKIVNPFEFKCNRCGKRPEKNDEKSNENWSVYNCKQKCPCGGEYVMWVYGEPLGGAKMDGKEE